MGFLKRLERGSLNSLIVFIFVFVSFSSLLVLLITMLRLSELAVDEGEAGFSRALRFGRRSKSEDKVGQLGEMMIRMLPDDLAFTIFVPSEKAFEQKLKLQANESLVEQKANDTYTILSRVLGFSAAPQHLPSIMVSVGREIYLDSVSGLKLYASKGLDGTLMVNTIQAEQVDIRRGELIVHIMNGVIMDAEFEQSFEPDEDDTD